MTEDQARAVLLKLDPIVSALAESSLVEHARENMGAQLAPGIGIVYMRLSAAIEGVGWDEAVKLTEVRRLLAEMKEIRR